MTPTPTTPSHQYPQQGNISDQIFSQAMRGSGVAPPQPYYGQNVPLQHAMTGIQPNSMTSYPSNSPMGGVQNHQTISNIQVSPMGGSGQHNSPLTTSQLSQSPHGSTGSHSSHGSVVSSHDSHASLGSLGSHLSHPSGSQGPQSGQILQGNSSHGGHSYSGAQMHGSHSIHGSPSMSHPSNPGHPTHKTHSIHGSPSMSHPSNQPHTTMHSMHEVQGMEGSPFSMHPPSHAQHPYQQNHGVSPSGMPSYQSNTTYPPSGFQGYQNAPPQNVAPMYQYQKHQGPQVQQNHQAYQGLQPPQAPSHSLQPQQYHGVSYQGIQQHQYQSMTPHSQNIHPSNLHGEQFQSNRFVVPSSGASFPPQSQSFGMNSPMTPNHNQLSTPVSPLTPTPVKSATKLYALKSNNSALQRNVKKIGMSPKNQESSILTPTPPPQGNTPSKEISGQTLNNSSKQLPGSKPTLPSLSSLMQKSKAATITPQKPRGAAQTGEQKVKVSTLAESLQNASRKQNLAPQASWKKISQKSSEQSLQIAKGSVAAAARHAQNLRLKKSALLAKMQQHHENSGGTSQKSDENVNTSDERPVSDISSNASIARAWASGEGAKASGCNANTSR